MRVRTYGLALLGIVAVAPLVAYGAFAVRRAETTAVNEVRRGNARLARSIANRLAAYAVSERTLLGVVGAAALLTPSSEEATAVLDAFSLSFLHLHDLAVYRADGSHLAGSGDQEALAKAALAGTPVRGKLVPAGAKAGLAHTVSLAEPITIAGEREGAVIARVDLVGLWEPVNSVTVGETGFVRLLSTSGELLAHGNPEERRHVFDPDHAVDARLLASAMLGLIGVNQQGEPVVASVALVPAVDGVIVVEQSVAEAFAQASAVKRDLFISIAVAVVFVVIAGLLLGRILVRGLERLRLHTQVLARGELDRKVDSGSRVAEIRALAHSLDDMASSLAALQEEAQQRDRLDTFARVAAGLAHDLRQPVEAVRMAATQFIESNGEGDRELLAQVSRRDLPRLVRYVEDLRRLAHSGELDLDIAPVSPRELADGIVGDLAASPKYAGVRFEAIGEAKPLAADPDLVRRAVTNLAQNGADSCLESGRGRQVTIEVADSVTPGFVEFRVTDQGRGIEPERVASVLKSDFRSTKRSNGVGLGLGVVRQVAESHRGRLELTSRVGEGSTFSLILPKEGPSYAQHARTQQAVERAQSRRHA